MNRTRSRTARTIRSPKRPALRSLCVAGALLSAPAVLAACGDDGGRFDDDVAAVRTAIADGDRAAAEDALDALAAEAYVAGGAGELSAEDTEQIARLIEANRALLDDLVPTSTTTTASTTTAPPPPDTEAPGKGEGNGKGKGQDKGRGGDEDDEDDDD